MQDLINEFLTNRELQNSLQRYFLQSFAALTILPLSFNLQGFLQRFALAVIATVFWQCSLGTLLERQYFLIDLISGFAVSLSLFLPVLVVIIAAELLEQSRGMNLSSFFTGVGIGGNSYIGQGVKLYVFVLLLQAGFLEQLFVNLSESLLLTSTSAEQSIRILADSLGLLVYEALTAGCKLAVMPLALFFLLHISFFFLAKVYTQVAFFSELFAIKLMLVALIIYLEHQDILNL